LCKRFFTETPLIFREMVSEDPTGLGVGVTDSGAGRGMAALDGLIAALEVPGVLLFYCLWDLIVSFSCLTSCFRVLLHLLQEKARATGIISLT
jgi:hypothetical protein